ncbi:alpha/beta hydrolase [Saccharibacillus sp. CPCC 101409]|uniref:alpha/beta hydrolase n=1 Tax=Saccharibacillus sp. CPCC 101409 TaxID=3058041 RepID=UPI0026719D1E|nr:alpha/beta hydrolase [Saccharibacillus sp. CPCC 101409]MDO3411805.1 alpha/beta hydrolase [Saccharibacillus sp. CPCC 101409]
MRHIFKKGSEESLPVLVLFHGTGGTEHDLIPLAETIAPGASILSLRGNVSENGMSRFFRRLAEGVFDEEDLVFRTNEIWDFLTRAASEYDFDPANLVALGYSNGANIAASLIFHDGGVFRGALLHHPMVPIRGLELPDLSAVNVFVGAGRNDGMVPSSNTEELIGLLESAGASVAASWEHAGHQLTRSEADAAGRWFAEHFGGADGESEQESGQ